MVSVEHKQNYNTGTIVGNDGSYGTKLYGCKLLMDTYVNEVGGYVWLVQYGTVGSDNKFTPRNGGKDIQVLTDKDIKENYKKKWIPDPEYKKGDVLLAETKSGKRVVLLYLDENHVERLTPTDEAAWDSGWGSLAHYKSELKNFKVHTSHLKGSKFSEL